MAALRRSRNPRRSSPFAFPSTGERISGRGAALDLRYMASAHAVIFLHLRVDRVQGRGRVKHERRINPLAQFSMRAAECLQSVALNMH